MFPLVHLSPFIFSPFSRIYKLHNNKKYGNKLNMEGIEYSVKLTNISKLENQNGLSVTAFGLDKESKVYMH